MIGNKRVGSIQKMGVRKGLRTRELRGGVVRNGEGISFTSISFDNWYVKGYFLHGRLVSDLRKAKSEISQ